MAVQTRKINDISQALVLAAKESGAVPEAVAGVLLVDKAAQAHKRFLAEYSDASIPLEDRRNALIKTFEKSVHPFVLNSLCLLQENGTLKDFHVFAKAVVKDAQTLAQHYEITVTSAVPLAPDSREEIAAILDNKFKGTQHINEAVDAGILGGLVITVGDWTLDASVKGKISRLRQTLASPA